ncbi:MULTISPECIES: hypothetical protein [unclassified Ruegeria]|uniref:hypothetical protein n=1 Tax=unclassified Ruegeria TaxID=2625375 RepID=UPI001488E3BD|nr:MULTISPECIES: hypothetical protein [unclassified Ruegeria]NOD65342.1 hypothetical protein [Ruegeria sp. HKCCD6109]
MEKTQRSFSVVSHQFIKRILQKCRPASHSQKNATPLPPNARMARDIGLTASATEQLNLRFPTDDYRHPML